MDKTEKKRQYMLKQKDIYQSIIVKRVLINQLRDIASWGESYSDVIESLLDERMLAKEK